MLFLFLFSFLLHGVIHCHDDASSKKKHVVVIITDDQGFNDVGYSNPKFSTPTIDRLKSDGLFLKKYYAASNCSPTRAALLTGRTVQNVGLADGAYLPFSNYDRLDPSLKLLPEYLKSLNYRTVALGKWHLGGSNLTGWPTNRGFDYFYGIIGGDGDEFTHRHGSGCNNQNPVNPDSNPGIFGSNCYYNDAYGLVEGIDMLTSELNTNNYLTELLGIKAVDQIMTHDVDTPLFMYLAPTAPHSPLQVPDSYLARCPDVTTPSSSQVVNGSRLICGMMAAVDDMVLNVTEALKKKGIYEDTLIIYSSDNGGVVAMGSNNGPYKGQKGTFYEGGVRVPAFLSGGALKSLKGKSYNDLVTMTDLSATILAYAGYTNKAVLNRLDGKSLLKYSKEKWIINDKFERNVVPISMAGENSAYSSGIVFKYNGRTWKYSNVINMIAWFVSYENTLLKNPYFFDLTNDPYEDYNIIENPDKNIQKAITYGIKLLNTSFTQGYPSPIDAIPEGYIINNNPSPLGCWLPLDYPTFNTVDCGGATIPPPSNIQILPITRALNSGYTFGNPIPKFPRTLSPVPSISPTFKPSAPTKIPTKKPNKKPTSKPGRVQNKQTTTQGTTNASSDSAELGKYIGISLLGLALLFALMTLVYYLYKRNLNEKV